MNKYLSGGDVKQVKKIAKSTVKSHEKTMHGKEPAKGKSAKQTKIRGK